MDSAALIPLSRFPSTRYQGSKRKLASQIIGHVRRLDFETALDVFGGTGAIAHALKCLGKAVTYNDLLQFNHQIGLALIENDHVTLSEEDIAAIVESRPGVTNADFIQRTFAGIYFTDEENRWLDAAVANIRAAPGKYKRALSWFALYQSALAKRPYNLFHRKNLYMRTADVVRGFGNKATWDRPFESHFRTFAAKANEAVIDSRGRCRSICHDALNVPGEYDLVYVDPPYINARGIGVDYHHFYHFLEGMTRYHEWLDLLDSFSKHLRLCATANPWGEAETASQCFANLFHRFRDSILVTSYRSDGIPSIDELAESMRTVKRNVDVYELSAYQYALSTNRTSREVLLIGT